MDEKAMGKRSLMRPPACAVFGLFLALLSCGLTCPALSIRQEAAQDNWARYSPGEGDLSIELPRKPEQVSFSIPEGARNEVTEMTGFSSKGSWVLVVLSRVVTRVEVVPK